MIVNSCYMPVEFTIKSTLHDTIFEGALKNLQIWHSFLFDIFHFSYPMPFQKGQNGPHKNFHSPNINASSKHTKICQDIWVKTITTSALNFKVSFLWSGHKFWLFPLAMFWRECFDVFPCRKRLRGLVLRVVVQVTFLCSRHKISNAGGGHYGNVILIKMRAHAQI